MATCCCWHAGKSVGTRSKETLNNRLKKVLKSAEDAAGNKRHVAGSDLKGMFQLIDEAAHAVFSSSTTKETRKALRQTVETFCRSVDKFIGSWKTTHEQCARKLTTLGELIPPAKNNEGETHATSLQRIRSGLAVILYVYKRLHLFFPEPESSVKVGQAQKTLTDQIQEIAGLSTGEQLLEYPCTRAYLQGRFEACVSSSLCCALSRRQFAVPG